MIEFYSYAYFSIMTNLSEILTFLFRPLVVKKICELFSLVPELHVETKEYEVSV